MTTTFGVNQLQAFKVWTDEVQEVSLRRPLRSTVGAWQP
jgi:hypothetical protein